MQDLKLIVFAGLPGTGKTTLAREILGRITALYLRIDVIEQAIRRAGVPDIGAAGYEVAGALAASHLATGASVLIDAVNPVRESRIAWRAIAANARTRLIEIELVCSDTHLHRARIEGRTADIEGLSLPSWQDVLTRHYEPWHEPHTTIDTAHLTIQQALEQVLHAIA